jgi:hypothetical protein
MTQDRKLAILAHLNLATLCVAIALFGVAMASLAIAVDTNRDINRFEQYRAQDNIDNLCLEFQIQKRAVNSDAPLPEICSKFDR